MIFVKLGVICCVEVVLVKGLGVDLLWIVVYVEFFGLLVVFLLVCVFWDKGVGEFV